MGHHFVPRRYLQRFQVPDRPGFIWLHDRKDQRSCVAAIAKVAQSKAFYSPETEKILADAVEAPGNRVMDKLVLNQAISPADRLQLAVYIAVMMKRVPYRRRKANELVEKRYSGWLAETIREVHTFFAQKSAEGAMTSEQFRRRLDEIQEVEARWGTSPSPSLIAEIHQPWPSERIVRAIADFTWRIVISSGPQYFVTSDNPAFFFESLGLGNPEAELAFPISTTHCLHGCRQRLPDDLRFAPVHQHVVMEINRRLISTAERLAFYHEPADWLLALLGNKNPDLNRIKWDDQ